MEDKDVKDVQVFGDVLMKPDEPEKRTAGGLYVSPGKFSEVINSGVVIKSKLEEIPEGSRIIHHPYGYSELKIGGEMYRVLNLENIIAVVK